MNKVYICAPDGPQEDGGQYYKAIAEDGELLHDGLYVINDKWARSEFGVEPFKWVDIRGNENASSIKMHSMYSRKYPKGYGLEFVTHESICKVGKLMRAIKLSNGEAVGEMNTYFWLAELDQYGNPKITDGPHSEREGAEKALDIITKLGLKKEGERYAIAEVKLSEPEGYVGGLDEDAIKALKGPIKRMFKRLTPQE